jgi:ATP-dependent helicase/nuclease subunit A
MGPSPSSPSVFDPSYPQKLAADPTVSAWVGASAGTGKTKVLIDRLLNLMLTGQDPGKILCLTFTKAAAAEMKTRLFQRLSSWVQMSDEALLQNLAEMGVGPLPPDLMPTLRHRARQLFTQLLDLPGGIKIQTIHGFCQMILGRFPLEAHIPPHFSIIDETAASLLLRRATAKVLHSQSQDHPELLDLLTLHYKDSSFEAALEDLLSHRSMLHQLTQTVDLQSYTQKLKEIFDIPPEIILEDKKARQTLILKASQEGSYDRQGLLRCLVQANPVLESWLAASPDQRVDLYNDYANLFLTQTGTIRKKLSIPHEGEAERIYRLNDRLNRIDRAQKSLVLFFLGSAIDEQYQQQKWAESALDYDDLIDKTVGLLNDPELAAWVLYKLDGGLDHILIDEAQDTNPAQWEVVKGLTQDFFRPDKPHRTLFIVGDSKQSIYSFQGVNPHDFAHLRSYFSQKSRAIGQTWRDVELFVSFRSAPEILTLVDAVLTDRGIQQKVLAESPLTHTPFRKDHSGKVRLWPCLLQEPEAEKQEIIPWDLPINRQETRELDQECAQKITQQMSHLLRSGLVLPSTQRPLQPRDILILVRKRSPFSRLLIRQLKQANIPVAGEDRFLLTSHLAVQDLLSLGQFLLQPQDDLALATVLTSPLIGLTHQELMEVAINRQGSLWAELATQQTTPSYQKAYTWLKKIFDKTDYLSPFDLFSYVLYESEGKKRLISRLSFEAEDVITEFLNLLLALEHQGASTLELAMGEIFDQDTELKRDSADAQQNEVRLMTIHGSKGLQAPVVILVEKFNAVTKINPILWQEADQGEVLLLARPPLDQDTPLTKFLKEQQKLKEEAEDKRLLYVALTRPQDHLYVCGYGNKKKEDDWYSMLEIHGVPVEEWGGDQGEAAVSTAPSESLQLPDFFNQPVELPKTAKSGEEKSPPSPEAHRGILIHKLLEILPDIPLTQRPLVGERLVQQATSDTTLQQDCLATAEKLLTAEDLKEFFGEASVAELEIVTATGQLIRLDRVVLGPTLKILDFKSTQNPPESVDQIPEPIRTQLESYKAALHALYPTTPIECYILWTTTGRLDRISDLSLVNQIVNQPEDADF